MAERKWLTVQEATNGQYQITRETIPGPPVVTEDARSIRVSLGGNAYYRATHRETGEQYGIAWDDNRGCPGRLDELARKSEDTSSEEERARKEREQWKRLAQMYGSSLKNARKMIARCGGGEE